MRLAEQILLFLSRKPGSEEYAGVTLNYTVGNALDFPLKTIPSLLHEIKDKVVLDYGCGPGYQAVAMAERGARSVVGVDEDILSGLNKMTLAKYEQIIEASGLTVEHQNFFATKNLPVADKIPYLREFLVSAVTCILVKDGTAI